MVYHNGLYFKIDKIDKKGQIQNQYIFIRYILN